MADHYYRRPDGQIHLRRTPQVDGVASNAGPVAPAGAVEIPAEEGQAAFAAAEQLLAQVRSAERAAAAESRRGVYEEALGLGFSEAAASAISGYRP